jgi:PAS domain S-box-containing protein
MSGDKVMSSDHQNETATGITPRKVSLLFGLFVAALGASVLVGWIFDITALKSVFPGLVTMKANTAMGMLLCGGALMLLSRGKVSNPIRLTSAVVAVVVIALGTLTLGEYLFGWEFGIDQLLFHDAANPTGTSQPGRMSPATAFCFLLAGCSLWMASRPPALRFRLPILAALGVTVIVVGGLALIGYATDVLFSLRWWNYTGMAIHTAAGFLLLGCGLLAFVKSEGGLRWSLDTLITVGFVIGIVSLLAAAGVSYHFTNQLQQSAAWVSHTQEVLKEIEEVSAGVATLGSSERNYINTGNEHLLEQEKEITDAIHENLDALRKLTADNPHQNPRLDQLEPLIAQRIDWGEQTVAARRQQGLSAAEQMIAAGRGIALSDSIRHVIKEMEDEEYSLLDQRQKKEQAISTTTFLLLPLGVFLSLTMLSMGLFFLNAGIGERAWAEEKSHWLASFPERNPNPIVELDLASGVVHYANPSAIRLFPNLQSEEMSHPLLAGLQETQKTLLDGNTGTARREISAGEFFFAQTITYIPEARRLRVYSTDITERKRAEEVRAQFAAIVESSDDAIISKTLDGIITSWNRGAEKLFGYPAQECVGKSMLMLFPPELVKEEPEILSRIRRSEGVDHFETVRVTKSGKRIDVSVTLSPIRNNQGQIIGASKIARDITERKHGEEALKEAQALYHSLVEQIPAGIFRKDAAGRYVFVNSWFCRLSATKPADYLGKTSWEFLRELAEHGSTTLDVEKSIDLAASGDRHHATIMQTGAGIEFDEERILADGRKQYLHVVKVPVFNSDGKIVGTQGMLIDITGRKQAEEARQTSEARYHTLFECAPDGIVIVDAKGYYLDVNASICRMLGYTRDEFIGLNATDIVAPAEIPHIGQALDVIKTNADYQREWQFRRKDGSVFAVDTIATAMPDGNLLAMIRDITERKVAAEKIHQLNVELEHRVVERTAQLEAANKELEAFSYSVSHDLRAPLRAVNGFAGIVLEEFSSLLPEEGRDYLERIRNGGQRMGVLIDDLLAFSRLSRQLVNRQSVNTVKLVQNVIDELKPQLNGRRIEIKVGELPACHGDPALLKQVWVNLISNAVKYTRGHEPAIVEIGCALENNENVYFVRDNGAGFDMQYANKLFGVFQRLHRSDEFEGTGVGLAIVQRIIHRHGGRVWAEAAVNRGATFYFTLEGENKL